MKNIEFRAKVEVTGEWVYGYYLKGENHYIVSPKQIYDMVVGPEWEAGEHDASLCLYLIDEDSLEMWSGMYDKFGNKIFENDIVRDNYGRYMRVIFNEQKAKFQFKLIKVEGEHAHWAYNFIFADFTDWFCEDKNYIEVVGEVNDDEQQN